MRDPKQFLKFCELLDKVQSDSIYGVETVNHILHEFWSGYFKKLLIFGFVPYCTGLLSFLSLLNKAFRQHHFDPDEEQSSILIEKFVSLIFIGYQII